MEVYAHKIILTPKRLIEVSVRSQEIEWACIISLSMLSVSTIVLFDFRIVPTMCYFLFFISLYIYIWPLFFLRLVDDDMLTFPVSSLASGLSWEVIIRFVVIGGIDYPQCLIFLFINNCISVSGPWEYWYFLHWNLYGKCLTAKAGTPYA